MTSGTMSAEQNQVWCDLHQKSCGQHDDDVERAAEIVTRLVEAKDADCGTREAAIKAVAHDCRLGSSKIRQLVEPARKPKQIGTGIWRRLLSAYAKYLNSELSRIRSELAYVEALGRDDRRPLENLLAETESIQASIRLLIK